MTIGEIYGTALKVQNLSNEEWDAFNKFFDERDVTNNDMKKENPALFNALCRMKENQAKIETIDALFCSCNGKFEDMTVSTSRELAIASNF